MSVSDDLKFKVGLTVVVLAGAGLAMWYAGKKVGDVMPDPARLNPFKPGNYFNAWVDDMLGLTKPASPQDNYHIPEDFGIKNPTSWE